jgi:ribosomal protein L12E/L44/L45/RPP1/RPP2
MASVGSVEDQIIENGFNILQPVLEAAVVLAGFYAASCKRSTITKQDMEVAMKFAARNVVGTHVGSLYPEAYEDDEDDDEEEEEEEEEDEEEFFQRYDGTDEKCKAMNECADSWDDWQPSSPAEAMLKRAVDAATM